MTEYHQGGDCLTDPTVQPPRDSSGNAAIYGMPADLVRDAKSSIASLSKSEAKRLRKIEAAKSRHAWHNSKESAQARRDTKIILATLPLWPIAGAIIGRLYASDYLDKGPSILLGLAGGLVVGIYVTFFLVFAARSGAHRDFEDRRLIGEAQEELKQVELEITGDVAQDFVTLWGATQKRLDLYHKIATTQSERSFLYGQIAAGIGFVVIIIAALIAGFSRSTGASIAAAVSGVAGGGLAAYIGKTFMKSQEAATAQLKAYFNQPLELSRYLEAERLLSLVNEKQRGASVNSIITSITKSPIVDQSAKGNGRRPLSGDIRHNERPGQRLRAN